MPEPPATPAVRAAKEAEEQARHAMYDAIVEASVLSDPTEVCDSALLALAAYRDAVAARVTAELMASGTPLWVATTSACPGHVAGSVAYPRDPIEQRNGDWDGGVHFIPLNAQLTPPGTVHQAVLLMKPEEAN